MTRSYIEAKEAQARALVGKRIEIPVHYDAWMRGARFGVVRSLWWSGGACAGVRVRLDNAPMLRIHRIDLDYVKVLEG